MQVFDQINPLCDVRQQLVRQGRRLALVPTMGALHPGHLSLIEKGLAHADEVWVSIFVNPTQFGPNEDFDRYPRTLEADLQACEKAGANVVWAPPVEVVYPPDVPGLAMDVPKLTGELEGAQRPDHFAGVCRVVAKLLCLMRPEVAVLGQKDYQQWRVIDAMVKDLLLPVEVIAAQTKYEPDGLAMSSRNRYLTAEQRQMGLGLSQALDAAQQAVEAGATPQAVEQVMADVLNQAGVATDYATVRDADDLSQVTDWLKPSVALVAGRVGTTRLLDNRLLAMK